jgi:hypothetical protein
MVLLSSAVYLLWSTAEVLQCVDQPWTRETTFMPWFLSTPVVITQGALLYGSFGQTNRMTRISNYEPPDYLKLEKV